MLVGNVRLLSAHFDGDHKAEIYDARKRKARRAHTFPVNADGARGAVIENQAYAFAKDGIYLFAQGHGWVKVGEHGEQRTEHAIYVYQEDDKSRYY